MNNSFTWWPNQNIRSVILPTLLLLECSRPQKIGIRNLSNYFDREQFKWEAEERQTARRYNNDVNVDNVGDSIVWQFDVSTFDVSTLSDSSTHSQCILCAPTAKWSSNIFAHLNKTNEGTRFREFLITWTQFHHYCIIVTLIVILYQISRIFYHYYAGVVEMCFWFF